ncbi:hypothetical protein AGABI2DRAFT_180762 [Agaricus bisporus var. bisporus H97]|uniref:hypothetical protein n=1 Tax=Agaricus bisporus var. bisporus (strain H97 / ATCC MYA-4626 / FGSC 10389) TaxID=936046 RepID=UPI00029F6F76|nr:hypothetical protein AGABI2DRAFT_180762 [Agaricus bisporus var. bisporus H97]EKV43702.1 hypothetical protein AGABI2DRAFT_180762 [Agaricus bisporus var. bisporus H97]
MSQTYTTTLYNQSSGEYEVLHVADLDVWVAYDGGTIIVVQGATGNTPDTGSSSGDHPVPVEVSTPDVRVSSVPAVTTQGAGGIITINPVMSISIPPTQSWLSINTRTEVPTVISETQAPSTPISLPTSESPLSTLSNLIVPSLPSDSLPATTSSVSINSSSSAVVSAKPTITVAPPTQSNNLSPSPPYYVAIVVGSIAGVATLAALIAWAFRRHAHAKRRRLAESASQLPWVYSGGTDDDDRSAGTSITPDVEYGMRNADTEVGITNLGSREDMAYVQAWEPRGDRDVGEPKRSEGFTDRKTRPPFLAQQIPSFQLFSPHSAGEFMEDTPSPHGIRVSSGTIDPQLLVDTLGKGSTLLITNRVPGDISVCSSQEAGFPSQACDSLPLHSKIGTPREFVPVRSYLALDGEGFDIPREEKSVSAFSAITDELLENKPRSRIMSAEHIRKTWDRNASASNEYPGISTTITKDHEPDGEGWANSIRSNLVNALNAVAANLPLTTVTSRGEEVENSDNLTPARPKRSLKYKELLSDDNLFSSLDRKDTISSVASNPWSFVDTGSNSGIVHIHLPASDTGTLLSHGTSDRLATADSRDFTLRNPEPLQIKKKLSLTPLSKRRSSVLSNYSRSRVIGSGSSSLIGSVSPSKRHKKASSYSGGVKRKGTIDRLSSPVYSRTTSMATISSTTSAVSIIAGTDGMVGTKSVLREVLKGRRRKAKRVKDSLSTSSG